MDISFSCERLKKFSSTFMIDMEKLRDRACDDDFNNNHSEKRNWKSSIFEKYANAGTGELLNICSFPTG